MALEEKENKVLRALKASKKRSRERADLNGVKGIPNSPCINKCSSEDQIEQPAEPLTTSNQFVGLTNHPSQFRKAGTSDFHKDLGVNCNKTTDVIDIDTGRNLSSLTNQNSNEFHPDVPAHSSPFLKPQTIANTSEDVTLRKSSFLQPMLASNTKTEDMVHGQSSSRVGSSTGARTGISNTSVGVMEEDVMEIRQPSSDMEILILDKITQDPPLPNIRKEASCPFPPSISGSAGDQCFAGGLIGPDGVNRYLGKWCKRTQTKTSVSSSPAMQGLSKSIGDLIAVGADGRGGY